MSHDFGFEASASARRLVTASDAETADELWLSFEPASGELDVSSWSDIVATRVTWDPRTPVGSCREPDVRHRLVEVGEAVMDFLRAAGHHDPLVAEALAAERETLSPACRSDPERLAAFIAPDFHEFGASGREVTREGTAEAVAAHTDPGGQPIGIEHLRGVRLADGIVMVTYTSQNAGARAHRTSLWRRVSPARWQMLHHQGTPTQEPRGTVAAMTFLPADFVAPTPIATAEFRLELLGPEHNESDYAAWSSSIDFIRGLPGWATSSWPQPMTIEDNMRDLESHLARSQSGTDFAYTVLLPERDEVIGCVYLYPTRPPRDGAVAARSWVTAEHADLDEPLHDTVTRWVEQQWPWTDVEYAPR